MRREALKQEGHDGPVSLHLLIREIHSYQTLHYLGNGLKQDPLQGLKLVAIVLIFSNKKILQDFTIQTNVKLVTLGNQFDSRVII